MTNNALLVSKAEEENSSLNPSYRAIGVRTNFLDYDFLPPNFGISSGLLLFQS